MFEHKDFRCNTKSSAEATESNINFSILVFPYYTFQIQDLDFRFIYGHKHEFNKLNKWSIFISSLFLKIQTEQQLEASIYVVKNIAADKCIHGFQI